MCGRGRPGTPEGLVTEGWGRHVPLGLGLFLSANCSVLLRFHLWVLQPLDRESRVRTTHVGCLAGRQVDSRFSQGPARPSEPASLPYAVLSSLSGSGNLISDQFGTSFLGLWNARVIVLGPRIWLPGTAKQIGAAEVAEPRGD